MKRYALPAMLALSALGQPMLSGQALAQQAGPIPAIAAGSTLLTVNAEGKAERAPDLAVFNAGVTTQGKTAGQALTANSAAMSRVIAGLKAAGVADRDIQTSNLSVSPVYSEPRRLPDGSTEQTTPTIVGYQVNNAVTVRQRKLADYGRVIDTLVSAGANQVAGPSFELDQREAALDEARGQALKTARARADLYARAAGLRVVRIVSIGENGGYSPPSPVMYRMVAQDAAAAAPVAAGEIALNVTVSVQFELAP